MSIVKLLRPHLCESTALKTSGHKRMREWEKEIRCGAPSLAGGSSLNFSIEFASAASMCSMATSAAHCAMTHANKKERI